MGSGPPRFYVAALVLVTVAATAVFGVGQASSGRSVGARDGSSEPAVEPRPQATTKKRTRPRASLADQVLYAAETVADVRAEADWILSAQLPDGAIAHYPDKVRVLPYLSSYASVGLARASAVTGDPRYVEASWKWLRWYQEHQSSEGFVTDFEASGDVLTSTGDMDSTDAYAGMFLYAAWTAWEQTHDRRALQALSPGITRAVRAMEATLDTDGLTWAKPTWHVKYLMDQAEVHAGFRSASKLFAALGDRRSARAAATRAAAVMSAIDALWQPASGAYDWAVHGDGARTSTAWTTLYPDAMQQAWAVAFGVASPGHSEEILNRFEALHPSWDDPETLQATTSAFDQYWPVAGWGMGEADRTIAAQAIKAAAVATGRAWPYHAAIAGQLIVLASGGPVLP